MNDDNRLELTSSQRLAQKAVRELSSPPVDSDFRARLKQDFMSGNITSAPALADSAPLRASKSFRLWSVLAPVAIAAVLAIVVFGLNPLPGPRVIANNGQGQVLIDGHGFPVANVGQYSALIKAGAQLAVTEGASLDIEYPGSLVMRIASGSKIQLPARPGHWFKGTIEAHMDEGEMSVLTGPAFQGNRLAVVTPDGQAIISGTLASVVANDQLTCICLIRGTLLVKSNLQELGLVEPYKRWVIYRDGRDPDYLDIAPPHQAHMEGLDRDEGGIFK